MEANDQILNPLYKTENSVFKERVISNHNPNKAEYLFSIILNEYESKLVDSKILKILERLKSKNIKSIALTSEYTGKYGIIESREDLRIQKLKKLGISFKDSFADISLPISLKLRKEKLAPYPLFKDGIIFACRRDKGKVLSINIVSINTVRG